MAGFRFDTSKATRHLIRKDRVLGRFIRQHGDFDERLRPEADLFLSLSRSIVYQQLSGKAAQTIFGRFAELYDGKPNADLTLTMDMKTLRGVGLSKNKALAILDLAARVAAGELPNRRKILRMPDDDIIDSLVTVRGIGPWTAQMFLMFNLGRPDVLPATDLGVQKGFQALHDLDQLPTPAQLTDHAVKWQPYRSIASWYLWRAADTALMTDKKGSS